MLAAAASAQCFETSFGTQILTGDDVLSTVQPMNIVFPMGGIAASYDACMFNTNGNIYLTNGTTAAVGTSATGYSTVAATMVTNLRGVAGNSPRIAAYWRDLNMVVANNAGVFLNNTIPGKCVITWKNAVHFSQTSPIFTVQAQLFSDGHVQFFYSSTTQNTAICPCVGISQGNGIADPGPSDLSTVSVGVSTSQIVYQNFATASTFDLQNTSVSFLPNGGGGYDVVPSACVPAANQNYGSGCYNASKTFYEAFTASTIDLGSSAIHLTLNANGGYTASVGAPTAFVHTVPGLALTDDSVAAVALPTPFNYPGGSTSSLSVCSNGYIWMQAPNTLADFSPTTAELFTNPARLCPCWCDLLPDGAANINNVFAEVDTINNKLYVSYVNCPTFTTPGSVSMQIEFNLATMDVNITYGSLTVPAAAIVGWAPGTGQSTVDVGSIDLSVAVPAGQVSTGSLESLAMALASTTAPVSTGTSGTAMSYTLSNIPEAGPSAGLYVGLHILSVSQIPAPGIDLGVALGAPGCFALVGTLDLTSAQVTATNSQTFGFALPAGVPAGFQLFSQGAAFFAPGSLPGGLNAGGIATSNGVKSTINSF